MSGAEQFSVASMAEEKTATVVLGTDNEEEKEKFVYSRLIHKVKNGELSPKEFGERLKEAWEFLATLSGFIAGFTFVVSNGAPDFADPYLFSSSENVKRVDVFSILVVFAFMSSLGATLISFMMMAALNNIGIENGVAFFEEHPVMVWIPEKLLVLSVFFMLISALVQIGGNSSNWVWILCLVAGVLFCGWVFYLFQFVFGSQSNIDIMKKGEEFNRNYKKKE